ncbi:MAG: YifB family Mg chelatase-like AAA ATPase [Candidatus Melainabacteria bacterium]|nr:YifB family Mg chelatase-like AAA ATPase [Candidatus Melainabacteria bacterium]
MAIQEEEIKIIEEDTKHYFAKINSCGLIGVNAYPVEVEVDISSGLPNFILVGLPDAAVNESRERVRAAIKTSNLEFPSKKITVNLAPADTKKAGPTYDLPIAIGILAGYGIETHGHASLLNKENVEELFIVGELGLSGKVRQVNGVLSFVILIQKLAKEKNIKGIIIPKENAYEASLIEGVKIYPVSDLKETINIINNLNKIKPFQKEFAPSCEIKTNAIDFSDVKGQKLAKRALEISASGEHHLLMIGSPGSGKSMLAQRLTTILPPLNNEEKIEVTQIYSICGKLNKERVLISDRPFRSPHHNSSIAGLIGGGSIPIPGEISLAHKGVLFLDELTEFQKSALDSLRQAIELKEITISRSRKSITFPCDFTLVTACNPCPCGYFGDTVKKCICSINNIKKYLAKISGPVLDRIDLQLEVKRLSESELTSNKKEECSDKILERILKARDVQKRRYKTNSHLTSKEIKLYCKLNSTSEKVLKEAIKTFSLTARSYDRLLKVSRTIADLESSDIICDEHILEALQFRLNAFIK